MKAFVLKRFGGARDSFEFMEQPDLKPTEGHVLVDVEAFGINYADIVARKGMYKETPALPTVIGYEAAGTIRALGAGVTGLSVGMRVACFTRFGGYATQVLAPAAGVVPISEGMDIGIALALTVQYSTAWYCSQYAAHILPGDHVLVQAAAGGVGTALVQIAKHRGAVVYGTAGGPEKIAYLKSMGVDHPIDYRTEDWYEKISSIRGKNGLNLVVDSLGGKEFKRGFKLLGPGGRIVGMGSASREGKGILADIGTLFGFGRYWAAFLLLESRAIIGCNMLRVADHHPQVLKHCLTEVMKGAEEGWLKPHVGKVFTHHQLAEAHEFVEQRKSIGKVFVKFE